MSAFCAFNLKSNMDRFIGLGLYLHFNSDYNLKSNMDRFIALLFLILIILTFYLKSNMDRFIALGPANVYSQKFLFKIQYG